VTARMRLRREDGEVYLNRWGWERDWLGGIFIHRMDAPDPGVDLHDHPWTFWSLIVCGGYEEERSDTRDAPLYAALAEQFPSCTRGVVELRSVGSVRKMSRLECHRVTRLFKRHSWSIVVHGPRWNLRRWGFYLPAGETHTWVDHSQYDGLERRKLYTERAKPGEPADR
jgi:hypothetical protein